MFSGLRYRLRALCRSHSVKAELGTLPGKRPKSIPCWRCDTSEVVAPGFNPAVVFVATGSPRHACHPEDPGATKDPRSCLLFSLPGFFAKFTLRPFDFAQGRSQFEGEWAQNDKHRGWRIHRGLCDVCGTNWHAFAKGHEFTRAAWLRTPPVTKPSAVGRGWPRIAGG